MAASSANLALKADGSLDLGPEAEAAAQRATEAPQPAVLDATKPVPPPATAELDMTKPVPAPEPAILKAPKPVTLVPPEEETAPAPTNIIKFHAPEDPAPVHEDLKAPAGSDQVFDNAAPAEPLASPDIVRPVVPPPRSEPPTPTEESIQQFADNPMGLPDDVAKKLVQQASAPAPAPENPHSAPLDPIVPGKPSAGMPGAKWQAPEEAGTFKAPAFEAPEEPPGAGSGAEQAKKLAQEGPDADIGPEQPYRERAQYLDNLIKPYDDDADRVKMEGGNGGGIENMDEALEAFFYAQRKNDNRLNGIALSPWADYLKTAEDVKNATKWLGTALSAGWNGITGLKDIPGQIKGTVDTAIDALKPQDHPQVGLTPGGAPKTWEQTEAPITDESKIGTIPKAGAEAGFNAGEKPKYADSAALNEADNLKRQDAQRALVAGVEEGNAQHTEFIQNAISNLIGIASTAPNAVLKLMGGPQIGYIDPKLQVALASNPGQPIPITSAKPASQMDPFEAAADIFAGRVQRGLHTARGSGYVGNASEEFLKAWNGATTKTPEQLAAAGYPVPIKKIQDIASTTNLTEGAVSLGLTGRIMEAAGLNSLLKTSADTVTKAAAQAVENFGENVGEFKMPKMVKDVPKGLVGRATNSWTGHAVASAMGLPPGAGYVVGGLFKNPVTDAVFDTIAKGVGYIPKAINYASAQTADALRLAAEDPGNMLATRGSIKQFLVRPMIAAKEGMIGMAPALMGARGPQELGGLVGMGLGMGVVAHALPDVAKTLQSRTIDSAFITDNNYGNSRKPAAEPTAYGTHRALDQAHAEAVNSINPETGKPLFSNQEKHTINNLRQNAEGMAEVYVLNPKPYAAELQRMRDLGHINNPDMNSRGVAIDPNPGQNMARILIRSDHFNDAAHHELSHPIVNRMALNAPEDLHTVFEAYSRNNDPNEFTLNYTRKAAQGGASVDYDHLPSEEGLANGTEQPVPGFAGMTKEDMQKEMATEAVSGLLKGGSIRSLTRDPSLLHRTQQVFWRMLDGMGFDPVSTRSISPLGLDQSLPAAMVLEPLVRETLRQNTGMHGGSAPELDVTRPGYKKPGAPKPEAAPAPPPGPDEGTIRGLMKTMGVDRTQAEAFLAKSKEGQQPDTSSKIKTETPADIAKQGLLLHRDVEPPFTPEEVEKHVPKDATNPLEAIKQAREAILAERGPAAKAPEEPAPAAEEAKPAQEPQASPEAEASFKNLRTEFLAEAKPAQEPVNPADPLAAIKEHLADPKWVKAVEERFDLKKGSMVPHESGVIHALTKDGNPITLNKDGSSTEGHMGAPGGMNPMVSPPAPPKTPKAKKTKGSETTPLPVTGTPQTPQPPVAPKAPNAPAQPSTPASPVEPEQQQQKPQAETPEAPPEAPDDFTTDASAEVQKKLRENGASPSEAQQAVIGKPKKRTQGKGLSKGKPQKPSAEQGELQFGGQKKTGAVSPPSPIAPPEVGRSHIGFFGYPGDSSWDSKSGRGIGAFPHSSAEGSMIPDYSAGLKKSEGARRGIRPGQEFQANGKTYRWDDIVPDWSPVGEGYVDVYSPGHPADPGVSPQTIETRRKYAEGVQGVGQKGSLETGESGGTLGSEAVNKAVMGEKPAPKEPEKPAAKEPEKPAAPKPEEPEGEAKVELPAGEAPEAPEQGAVTSESIQQLEAQLRDENPQGKRQGEEAYEEKIGKEVWQQAGLAHAESLPKYDTRVKYDPETGFMTGTHFDPSDPFHQWLLKGQNDQILARLSQVEDAVRNRKEVFADHASAPQQREGLPTGQERKLAQQESPPADRIEKGKEMAQMAGKHILPSYVGVTRGKAGSPNTLIFGGVSPDKVNSNAATIAHELGPHSPYPPGPLGKGGGAAEEDMRGYFENSANGFTGDGHPITPLAGREMDVPVPPPGFEPYQMTKAKSDFWNLATTGSGAKLSTKPGAIKSANALKLAEQNEGGFTSKAGYTNELAQRIDMSNPPQPVMESDPENPKGPKLVKLDKAGQPVTEPWTKAKLHSGYEMLHLKNFVIHEAGAEGAPPIHAGHEAATRAMQEKGLPNAPTVKAGFMPGEISPERVVNQYEKSGDTVHMLPTAELDKRWKASQGSEGFRIPEGGSKNTIGIRYQTAQDYLKGEGPINAPRVSIDEQGSANFVDGRHTFSAMRDSGMEKVPVALTDDSIENAKNTGLINEKTRFMPGKVLTKEKMIPSSPEDFIEARDKIPEKYHRFLSELKPEDLANHNLVMNKDRTIGLAVDPQGDIQNVFNAGGPKGAVSHALVEAINQGALTLDAYDGFLPDYYRQLGFQETGRIKFNPEYAHGFTEADGTPDVVFMAWKGYPEGGGDAAAVRGANRREWIKNEPTSKYESDWDTAKAASRSEAIKPGSQGDNRGTGAQPGTEVNAPRDQLESGAGGTDRGTLAPTSVKSVIAKLTRPDMLKKNEHQRALLEKQQAKLDTTKPEEDAKWDELAGKIHDLEKEHAQMSEPKGDQVNWMPGDVIEGPNGERELVSQAAIQWKGKTFTGLHHAMAVDRASQEYPAFAKEVEKFYDDRSGRTGSPAIDNPVRPWKDGFTTSTGRFVDRASAWKLSRESGQVTGLAPKNNTLDSSELLQGRAASYAYEASQGLEKGDQLEVGGHSVSFDGSADHGELGKFDQYTVSGGPAHGATLTVPKGTTLDELHQRITDKVAQFEKVPKASFMPGDEVEGPNGERERIKSPAVKLGGKIFEGVNHEDAFAKAEKEGSKEVMEDYNYHQPNQEGFTTSSGRFIGRHAAWQLAKGNRQIKASALESDRPLSALMSEELFPKTGGSPPREDPSASKVSWMPGDEVVGPKGERERIATASIRYPNGNIYHGSSHLMASFDAIESGEPRNATYEDGFSTVPTKDNPEGRFIGRDEAWKIAKRQGQVHEDDRDYLDSDTFNPEGSRDTIRYREPKASFMPMAGEKGAGFEKAKEEGRTFLNPYDQRPRYEISDHDLEWKNPNAKGGPDMDKYEAYKLGDLIDHPKLFEDYPHLSKINVVHDPDMGENAAYSSIDPQDKRAKGLIAMGNPARKDLLIHEIQHAIQAHEGFAGTGTNTSNAFQRLTNFIPQLREQAGREFDTKFGDPTSEDMRDRIRTIDPQIHPDDLEKDVSRLMMQHETLRNKFIQGRVRDRTLQEYRNNSGEIEAREAEGRTTMTPEERLAHPPFNPSGAKWIDQQKAWNMPGELPKEAIPVEWRYDKDGNQKLDNKGRPIAKKLDYGITNAPILANKQPEGLSAKSPDLLPKDRFEYLNPTARREISALDKNSATGTYAKKIASQAKEWMKDPEIAAGAGWYSRMVDLLSQAFGKNHEMFTHLLGVTSPNEKPLANFLYSLEAFEKYERGDYARHIDLYKKAYAMKKAGTLVDHVTKDLGIDVPTNKAGEVTPAGAMAAYIKHHDIIPTRDSETKLLYGYHSVGILKALAETWKEESEAPKTKNYADNLFGTSTHATIDVWAARMMRRLGYEGAGGQWRILEPSEKAVADKDFAFSQLAFDKAAKLMGPEWTASDLQAICWFGEKGLWENRGWSDPSAAEKSSLDTPFHAAFPQGPKGPRLPHAEVRAKFSKQLAKEAAAEAQAAQPKDEYAEQPF